MENIYAPFIKLRTEFMKEHRKIPQYLYMSKLQMRELTVEIREQALQEKEEHYRNSPFPELIPRLTFDRMKIEPGCRIFGMEIVEALTDEPYLR